MGRSIRCALCGDGPYKEDFAPPSHERVIYGFYFCAWCFEYADWDDDQYRSQREALVERARKGPVPRAYSPVTT